MLSRFLLLASSLTASLLFVGCALQTTATPVEERGASIQGHVHGGQQPVSGAHVYLLAANNAGYPTATTNASKSLMKFVAGSTLLDISSGPTNGFYYVTTDLNGNFNITGDYTCTANQQVYVYVVGGNPGAGTNSAAGFLAVLGNCPAAGNFASTVPALWINEVTTVAAAYSMAGFAYDALHVSSPTSTLSRQYIANAFANANNIVSITSGTPFTTLPNNTGTGAPNTLNTLANILASCVNSTGPSSNNCATLFTLAKTNGATGTAPTDTATAAINIAHNQGSNAAALFALLGAVQAFNPSYSTAPADFSLPIHYSNSTLGSVTSVAVDATGNLWMSLFSVGGGAPGLAAISPQGNLLYSVSSNTYFPTTPRNILVSAEGAVYATAVTNYVKYIPGGSLASYSTTYYADDLAEYNGSLNYLTTRNANSEYLNGIDAPGTNDTGYGYLALDGLGRSWEINTTSGTLTGWDSSGTRLTPATAGYTVAANTQGIAIDQSNNIWAGGQNASSPSSAVATKFSATGTALATFSDANMTGGGNLYVDGGNNVFMFGGGTNVIDEFDTNGNLLQTYGRLSVYGNQHLVAFDGSGNAWLSAGSGVYELIGLTVPVVTPIPANLVSPYTTPASKPQ